MRKFQFLVAAVMAAALIGVPSAAAVAAKPPHPTTPASANASANARGADTASSADPTVAPTVMFVLRGTLGAYIPATSTTNGSISITVGSSNFERTALKGLTLTFATSPETIVVLHEDKPITLGDRGVVKIRAPKGSLVATLLTKAASQVIDQGAGR